MSRLVDISRSITLATLASLAPVSESAILNLPLELVEVARAEKCDPIEEFFDRPGYVDPPYVYGVLPGDRWNSAALWCKRVGPAKTTYLILLWERPNIGAKKLQCPREIVLDYFPAGLSARKISPQKLSGYFEVGTDKKAAVTLKQPVIAIASRYDGTETTLVCHSGKWLYRAID